MLKQLKFSKYKEDTISKTQVFHTVKIIGSVDQDCDSSPCSTPNHSRNTCQIVLGNITLSLPIALTCHSKRSLGGLKFEDNDEVKILQNLVPNQKPFIRGIMKLTRR